MPKISTTIPVLSRTPSGWLAISAPGSAIRVGTVGTTRDEAKRTFATEIRAWVALAEKPE